jgi:ATP-dependent 26S proteasome regulatory subunit
MPDTDDLQWALQRRLEDVFSKIGEKYGDLTGRVETTISPQVTFDEIGGVQQAKAALRGFVTALKSPERYNEWGTNPPKGVLLYGPPGTGKAMLARALAGASDSIFFHLKLLNITSKFGANTADLLQEILRIAIGEGRTVFFMEDMDALSLDHLLAPQPAREASARLVAALCEKLDGMDPATRVLMVGATARTDALDSALVAPGRLDHLVEVMLPDAAAQQEILEKMRGRAERKAGRALFQSIDYVKLLPMIGGMSGADLSEILRRALEAKVHRSAEGGAVALVSTTDLLEAIDGYKRVRGVVEKIRYGQYL